MQYAFRHITDAGSSITCAKLLGWVTSRGYTPDEAARAITYWRLLKALTSDGTWFTFDESVARRLEAQTNPGEWTCLKPGPIPWNPMAANRPVALVSLFDGSGLARVTVDVLLDALRQKLRSCETRRLHLRGGR